MAYTTSIASRLSQFGKTELGINLTDSDGFKPFKRYDVSIPGLNPSQQELDSLYERLITRADQEWEESQTPPVDYYVLIQQALDGYIAPGTYDAVRQVLAEFRFRTVQIGDAILNVTGIPQVYQDLPPNNESEAIAARLDALRGPNTFEAVKTVLRNSGFGEVILNRESRVEL